MEILLKWKKRGKLFGRATVYTAEVVELRGTLIPLGFRTDGATLPWFVRAFLPPLGDYFPAALLHDWLLEAEMVPRREAAHEFKAMLKDLGMPEWLTNVFFWGVRANDHLQELKEKF